MAPSAPATRCATSELIDRTHSCVRRLSSSVTRARRCPSGESAIMPRKLRSSGGRTMNRTDADSGGGATRSWLPTATPMATAAVMARAATAKRRRVTHRRRDRAPPGIGWPAIHLSSSTRSTVDCHRASGSFARQRRTTRSSDAETSGRSDETAGGSVCTTAPITADEVAPSNALRPVSISNNTAPNAKMSLR